ncbi:hypothetical protein PPROV_000634100 [Pycnococcus provasolii]|uniref:PAS domain-containing protein n=3 Tax=Pseudoscourfieldiales TaxID=3417986 RepID=A0A830HRF9_9CHLO|nr:putative LOV domain-containing protein [Pseudoscourfieldia marina]GHP07599.1 hypothetical protein PPROV_000634100 [Pycnococcus provasolii]|mmetsp:Transcript_6334/g.16435  ORF Transcript_6334/g.16435 Transcript_6334/m.16435 type:complete len:214 (-) Transcript_6334:726-1367(-)
MSTATPPTSNVRHWARKHAHNSVSDELALALYTRVKGAFVLSDPTLPDTPLVYVSPGFEKMSGYSAAECLGRNCRFLQGPETDQEEVRRIREAVEGKKAVSAHLLNFRKDGEPFINSLHIAPVHSASGSTKFFAGVQLDPGAFVDDSGIAIFRSWSNDVDERRSADFARNSVDLLRTSSHEHSDFPTKERRCHNAILGKIRVTVRTLDIAAMR